MARIELKIDSDATDIADGRGLSPRAADKIGLLSTITLSQDLIDAFETGAGQTGSEKQQNCGYKKNDVKTAKETLKANNKVIATVGGSIALDALTGESSASMPPFVSLVGSVPQGNRGNCRGGVSLESYSLNQARKNFIKGLGAAYTDASIFLLTNKNSSMHASEQLNWGIPGTFAESYVGGDGLSNDATQFGRDFTGGAPKIGAAANAVIISDDPYFQANRGELIYYANKWLEGDASRRVVYPSMMYSSGVRSDGTSQTPTANNKSILFGPDLISAYELLGILAYRLLRDTSLNFGFFTVPNQIVTVT